MIIVLTRKVREINMGVEGEGGGTNLGVLVGVEGEGAEQGLLLAFSAAGQPPRPQGGPNQCQY